MKEAVSLMAALASLYVLEIAGCGEEDKNVGKVHFFKKEAGCMCRGLTTARK